MMAARVQRQYAAGMGPDPALQVAASWRRARSLLVFTLIAAGCAWWSLHYASGPAGFSMLWLQSGLLVGVLLTSPRSQWPGYLCGALLASLLVNVQHNGASWLGLALSVANVLDAWLVAGIVRWRVGDVGRLADIKRILRVGGLASLLASACSAVIATSASLLAHASTHGPAVIFEIWFSSHALGLAIFGTLTVIARVEGRRMFESPGRRLALAADLALVAVVTWLVFSRVSLPLTFLVFPFLLFCVLRHRFSGFVPAVVIIAMLAAMESTAGRGPFAVTAGLVDEVAQARMLQLFTACACLLTFPVAAVLTERRILARKMARSELQYRTLAEYSRDLIMRLGADRTMKYISPSVTELLGWTREEFDAARIKLVHSDDVERVKLAFDPLFSAGGKVDLEYRLRHKQGHYVWMAATARSVPAADGKAAWDIVYTGRNVTARVEAQQALERLAREDALTGLANRLHFDERIRLALARAARTRLRVGLLYFDIDFFKAINDTHGHAAGDAVLREFAQRIRASCRAVDLQVRLGGDEFAVLVEDLDGEDIPAAQARLRTIAEKLLQAMRKPVSHESLVLDITISVGIGLGHREESSPEALLHLADTALYAAKAAGRNTWRLAVADEQGGAGGVFHAPA